MAASNSSLWWVALALLALAACGEEAEPEVIYVDRSGCLACHRPLMPDGTAVGLEEAHPPVHGQPLACQDCHGGDPEARKQSLAHVQPLSGDPRELRGLSVQELDDVGLDYLRFVNPGDLRVAPMTCGAGSPAAAGSGCHQGVIDAVTLSPMATTAGLFAAPRYRAGQQRNGAGVKAVRDVRDESFRVGEVPGATGALDALLEPRVTADETEIGPYQELYLSKECVSCHLWSFGDSPFPGNYRSSGCSACHMLYGEDGLSRSADPVLAPGALPRPLRHQLTAAIPTQQCVTCHYRGGRSGLSFQGYRDSGGQEPSGVGVLGKALHGREANYYIADEDISNDVDETPPDVHFEAGMHCIDCHLGPEVHGDGKIYTHTANAVSIECEDCHGDAEREATGVTSAGFELPHLSQDEQGDYWLVGRVDGARHPVSQVKRLLEAQGPGSRMHQAMGRQDSGFSHLDRLECYTCHSGWAPTCFGCHVEVDMTTPQASQINGRSTPGAITEAAGPVRTDVLLLMLNTEGRISPSMPSVRMFFSATNGAGEKVLDRQVRTGPNGEPGMGHRAFMPHTVVKRSPWMNCDRCHLAQGGANMELVKQTLGFGSQEFLEEDGQGQVWALDQLLEEESFLSTVLVGHDQPAESRPLTREIIERALSVEVPASQ